MQSCSNDSPGAAKETFLTPKIRLSLFSKSFLNTFHPHFRGNGFEQLPGINHQSVETFDPRRDFRVLAVVTTGNRVSDNRLQQVFYLVEPWLSSGVRKESTGEFQNVLILFRSERFRVKVDSGFLT